MKNNDTSPDEGGIQDRLERLMSDAERTAARTLVEETVTSPGAARQSSIDSVFDVLSDPGRRYVLTYLLRAEDYVTMSELVDYVMAQAETGQSDEKLRDKITINLTHTHLPRLEEAGFITYNMERQLIMPTEKTPLARPYLQVALLQQQQLTETLEPN